MKTTTYPATDKQRELIRRLLDRKQLGDATRASFLTVLAGDLTKGAASVMIDTLFGVADKDTGPVAREGYYTLGERVFVVVNAKATGRPYAKELSVSRAACPGHLDHSDPSAFDAPLIICDEPCGRTSAKWVYAPGVARDLAALTPLTVEEAARLGRLHGVCVICGSGLTDPDSVQRGIGPVCAAKL